MILLHLSFAAVLIAGTNSTPFNPNQTIIAEGTYVDGESQDRTHEQWVLSKTAKGIYVAEGAATKYSPESEILHYRVEMDEKLHPSFVELHTVMDYPSYTCKLTTTTVRCTIGYESPNPETRGKQNARVQAPFDLFGFHSYGWILSSVVGRLQPGRSKTTVHLFLPNEVRWPNAVAEVRRETPDSITVAGKTFAAQRFTLKLIMDSSDISSATVWTSHSGLVLKVQAIGESSSGNLPVVELTTYKQTGGFVAEMQ